MDFYMWMRIISILFLLIPISHASDRLYPDSLASIKKDNRSVIVIDTRLSSSFKSSHIPSSINWPENQSSLQSYKIEYLNNSKLVVLYGDLSSLNHMIEIRSFIESSGCCDVQFLYEGIYGWLAEGYSLNTVSGMKPYEPLYIQEKDLREVNDIFTVISVSRLPSTNNSSALSYSDYLSESGFETNKFLKAIKSIDDTSAMGRWVVFDRDIENVVYLSMKLANLGVGSSVILK